MVFRATGGRRAALRSRLRRDPGFAGIPGSVAASQADERQDRDGDGDQRDALAIATALEQADGDRQAQQLHDDDGRAGPRSPGQQRPSEQAEPHGGDDGEQTTELRPAAVIGVRAEPADDQEHAETTDDESFGAEQRHSGRQGRRGMHGVPQTIAAQVGPRRHTPTVRGRADHGRGHAPIAGRSKSHRLPWTSCARCWS